MVTPRSPIVRLSLGLVALTWVILLGLDLLGLTSSGTEGQIRERIQLVEALAQQATVALSRNDPAASRQSLGFAVHRHDSILSAGLRSSDGRLVVATTDHRRLWDPHDSQRGTPTHASVPLFNGGKPWGRLEVRFDRLAASGILEALWGRPVVRLMLLVGAAGFLAYALYLRRTLRHLDPSAVVPTRVQAALDVMVEGVLLLDEWEHIVLVNAAFEQRTGRTAKSLLGMPASSLGWKMPKTLQPPASFPWTRAIRDSTTPADTALAITDSSSGELRIFMAKSAPVLDGWGRAKGAIATFDDITELEQKTAELEQSLAELRNSKEQIRRQNVELEVLARQDPLTGVSNRRHLVQTLEPMFADALENGRKMCCVMADIDHFKKVNDTHGHNMGDEVIGQVAQVLASVVRSSDYVCRFGGEEFLVILPDADIEPATKVAERVRGRIDSPGFARIPVTVSFGVSSIAHGARTFAELIDQADEALYASKNAGRNRVTRWDAVKAGRPAADDARRPG